MNGYRFKFHVLPPRLNAAMFFKPVQAASFSGRTIISSNRILPEFTNDLFLWIHRRWRSQSACSTIIFSSPYVQA
jgi:hypothetical protein